MCDTFKVFDKCCNECLFGPNKIVSDARKEEILKPFGQADQNYFVCHKASVNGDNICCKGFYEANGPAHSLVMRLAHMTNSVEVIELKEYKDNHNG